MNTAPENQPLSQLAEITLRDQQAATYDQWIRETKGPYFDWVDRETPLRWLQLAPEHSVLGAGCGTGRFTIPIAQRCREVWALDFSPKSIEVLAEKTRSLGLINVKASVTDLASVELPANAFDRAVSNSVIHHIPTAEGRQDAVRRVCASLKPGGLAVFMVFRWGGAITYQKEYWTKTETGSLFRMGFTAEELRALLRAAGFHVLRIGGIFNFRPRGLSKLPFLLKPYACFDRACARLPVSAHHGKHLLALATK